ncbi:hypothetical protein [Oceanimonas baumannii]|uniref:Phytanoyl-CoA dioxygenase n=1 Tax=Oceanimonas baumannii TaxID=129578 RepID=A0A235CIZ0_9GAMM|nr:hypothetical protein [Oceanimonas baumannii]OYD23997.1 hypothetical protein B6S09_11140 [Oceanimonas baumannii]TDW58665.1 hypothetical protein LY04_02016 [Oceanimonas baumannii]
MNIYHLDQPISDKERAERLFCGDLLIYRNISAMTELVTYSDQRLRAALDGRDPTTAQQYLSGEAFIERTGTVQTAFRTSDVPKTMFFRALKECGVDLKQTYYDHFPMRVVPYSAQHQGALRAAIGHHRDTWGSNIQSQINWWAPLYPLEEQRTIAFYPHYWNHALANNTATWSFAEYLATRNRTPTERQVDYPSAPHPTEAVDESDVVKVVLQPGDILNFSSAHLHASVTNVTNATRFSVEMRTINRQDLRLGREAPNQDNAAATPMYSWFRSILDKHPLQP